MSNIEELLEKYMKTHKRARSDIGEAGKEVIPNAKYIKKH